MQTIFKQHSDYTTDQGAMTVVGAARRAEIVEEGCGRWEWGDIRSGRWEQWTQVDWLVRQIVKNAA